MASSRGSDMEAQSLLGGGEPALRSWKERVFPGLSCDKSILWITTAQIVMYVVSCVLSKSYQPNEQTLMLLGAAYAPAFSNLQLWRVVTPLFLHATILHLVLNLVFILHISLRLEERYGTKKFLATYFFSAIVGNLLSMLVQPWALSVGASTAGFGVVGGLTAELSAVWGKLSEELKQMYSFDVCLLAVLIYFLSFGRTVDTYGHLGGFLAGVAVVCYYNKDVEDLPKWFNFMYYVCSALCAVTLVVSPLVLLLHYPYRVASAEL
ncbi:Rhomboid family 1 (Predicted), related [Neospora caninum Liverpool]|uniref:Rhomboid-like protease n=1 Tax=Neospora caninum (strain Liverpool) TaxID=572307 RepID=F0VCZ3_NEOCL|nr:Rhomboid family 1 (Predicted), related [Neospora caninum Liverpool]CBZ51508.1 Rhomboid family 1 (Predicted), related [Neospora caninum Liverpool]CEL65458.1 TPA: Rhomboid family 1 (Predicted), related [Neospora caninum Liverpool]|eukprot:XP_003881541.1 Rhomboid family 1 (Predicted), related [Neospora caninum Liverpool]